MEVYVWGIWYKLAFLVLLLVLVAWAVIVVRRAATGDEETLSKKIIHLLSRRSHA